MARKPRNLGEEASEFWDEVTSSYRLRPDEKRVLVDVVKTMDTIEHLEAEMESGETYLTGSMGQKVLNGIYGELRQQRKTLAGLVAQLKLPDLAADGSVAPVNDGGAEAGRLLAAKRWGTA
jgi:hypothetical protein